MADEEKIILTLEADDEASGKIDKITGSIRNLEREASGVGNGLSGGISGVVQNIESVIDRVNKVTRHYNMSMQGFNRSVIRGVKEMGSAVYDFTSESINNFTQFSEQHAKTLGAMASDYDNTRESQRKFFEDAQKLKEQALMIGTYGVNGNGALMNVQQVSQAQTELVKAGVPAQDIVDPSNNITSDVLKFAQANDLNTSQAVEFAVTLGNQFGIDKKNWGLMLDKVSHTADMSIIDVADIVQSMKYAGGITSGLNRDLEETLGMISILGDFGLKGSQGGSGIQALLTRLLTGDSTVITQAQAEVAPGNALEKFYEFEKIAKPDGNLLPMADVVNEMDNIMSDMTDEEQAWFAKKLFGLYQMKSAYALLNGDESDLNDVIKEIREQSEGTNDSKLEQLLNSQYGQLTSLNNLVEGIKTDVGDRLSPFVDAIRDELFAFLSNDGNYNINFDNLRSALDESCNLIEEKYGSAISKAVRDIGGLTIDLAQVGVELAPELGSGMMEMLSSLFEGDFFGSGGVFDDWGNMIDNMYQSVDGLPEEMQNLGNAVVSTIDWFGKLIALNVASEIAELISSVLQILTIAGGAVINVAGAVVVNGSTTGGAGGIGGAGSGGASTAGAGSAGSALKGSSVVGSADDVAKALGTTTDDVISTFGKQASYSIDDIARGLGTSADDVVRTYGSSIDDIIKAGAGAVDDVAVGGGKLFGQLSKTGKVLGVLGTLWQIGTSGYEAYKDFTSGDNKGGTEAIGGGVGSLGGAYGGAAIGTALAPGIGTVIGAIIGGFGGDMLGRELFGGMYDNFSNANKNYGTWAAGLPIVGGLWQKDGTLTQQNIDAYNRSERNKQESMYGIKPSDFGLPKVFDNSYNGKTGEIPWNTIISELQKARDYPITWGNKESKWGMNVDEAKAWQDSQAYKDYITALNGAKDALINTQKELEAQMVQVKKGEAGYDSKLDVNKTGQYSVWTGTKEELNKYLSGKTFISDPSKSSKGTISDPYMLSDMTEAVKNGIISGMSQANKNGQSGKTAGSTDKIDNVGNLNVTTGNTNLSGDVKIPEFTNPFGNLGNVTLNSGSTNMTGSVTIPNIDAIVKQIMPNGYAALSDKGKQDLIQNEINNQINIDDTVTMQPSFSVAAPNVNVNVRVDKEERIIKQVSILNPQQGTLLNNWYSRTSSQYGKTNK